MEKEENASASESEMGDVLAAAFRMLAEEVPAVGAPVVQSRSRLRILQVGVRPLDPRTLQTVVVALKNRKRLRILYHGRNRDLTTERTVSPQRLVCYRGNWYLDTWCHLREGLRHFALDRLHPLAVLDEAALDIDDAQLDAHFASAYGIFSGQARETAVLRFSSAIAGWVADEVWHPQQTGEVRRDGSFELRIPYSDERELIMDVLRYGPDVEVVAPESLRHRVAQLAARTAAQYRRRP